MPCIRACLSAGLCVLFLACFAPSTAGQDRYDVVWDSPSEGPSGSMPLGNGEVSVNAWVEESGDLVFYIGRTDTWGDNGRLLKLGRVRVHLEPSPAGEGGAFRQRLHLADATMEARFGEGDAATAVRLWVDANHPVVNVTIEGPEPREMIVSLEPWRLEPEELVSIEVSDVMLDRSKPESKHAPTIVEPDTLLDCDWAIGWYHHNARSVGPALTAKLQGLDGFERSDPLLARTFGAICVTLNPEVLDQSRMRCGQRASHHLRVYTHTAHPAGPEKWRKKLHEIIEVAELGDPVDGLRDPRWASEQLPRFRAWQRADHEACWREFWQRSWIDVTQAEDRPDPEWIPANDHPVRIGFDQHGGNRFDGELKRVGLYAGVCSPAHHAYMSAGDDEYDPATNAFRFSGNTEWPGALEDSASWDFSTGLIVEALVRPAEGSSGGGRIVDKITPGGDDGFLFDTHPGNSLRLIVGGETLHVEDVLTPGKVAHVVAVADLRAGALRLFLDGELLAEKKIEALDDAFVVSRGYALQRYLDACAGRGNYPIKFNGSIFTVPNPGSPGDADYRRWGPGYWWQNTRLPYLSMCTSGDFELMKPLFEMYAERLMPLNVHRTQRYFGHGGAFFPECIYFWGEVFSETYGWTPFEEREDKLQESGWHKWEWVAGPELVWMMLDYHEHTQDAAFLEETLLPAAHQILTFFDEHYELDENGKLIMHPAQAVETWWDCTNPMPEVAGLHAVTARLLALPESSTTEGQRAFWNQLRSKLPDLPLREVDGVSMLAPAERFEQKRNIENPELYAVFPFRLVSFEKDNVELGRAALEHRWDRGHFGWRQDDLFMAYLGLAEEARANLVQRARSSHAGSRFPAFWGPNYDWVPDQDHGGILMRTLQSMLMQTEGKTIHLFPAWPKDWDVSFRLHAPYQTTIEGELRGGELLRLKVTPESRASDVLK